MSHDPSVRRHATSHEQHKVTARRASLYNTSTKKQSSETIIGLKRAMKHGSLKATLDLADRYRRGDGVSKSVGRSVYLLEKGVSRDDASAMNSLGIILRHGNEECGVEKNAKRAKSLFEQAIELGNVLAINNLAGLLQEGDFEEAISKDLKTTKRLYERCIQIENNTVALYNLAKLLQYGGEDETFELKSDPTLAKYYYEQAVDQQCSKSMLQLARMYRTGCSDVLPDLHMCIELFKKAIVRGEVIAMMELASLYHHGTEEDKSVVDHWGAHQFYIMASREVQDAKTKNYIQSQLDSLQLSPY